MNLDGTDEDRNDLQLENEEREVSSPRSIDNKSVNSATIQYKGNSLHV